MLFVPPLIALVLMWRGRSSSGSYWIAAIFFLVWIAGWIMLEAVVLRTYSCPSCGHRIKGPTIPSREAGDPIRYYCPRCDVEWETGLSESGE